VSRDYPKPALLRITRLDAGPEATTLRLEGHLTAGEVPELSAACASCLAEGRRLVLDLSELRFLDEAGAAELSAWGGHHVLLQRGSGFVRALMAASGPARPARPTRFRGSAAGGAIRRDRSRATGSGPATAAETGPDGALPPWHGACSAGFPMRREARKDQRDRADASGQADLLTRLRSGGEQAFEELVRGEGPRLLAVARRILRDEEEARDAVQDAFLAAFRALDRFQGEARLSTWLHRIAVNAALMRLRSRKRRREDPIEPLLPRFHADGHLADVAPSWPADPLAALGRAELLARVRACIDRLPETYRVALVLRDIEGLDSAEAAETLGISNDALKMRLHRARQALRKLVGEQLAETKRQPAEAQPRAGSVRPRPSRRASAVDLSSAS
jgi:RNA polymerase sigma-70 factor (ECF subfamily)